MMGCGREPCVERDEVTGGGEAHKEAKLDMGRGCVGVGRGDDDGRRERELKAEDCGYCVKAWKYCCSEARPPALQVGSVVELG